MASKRSKYGMSARANTAVMDVAAFTGAAAAAIVVAASTVLALRNNYAAPQGGVATIITRNGVGDHTITFPEAPTVALYVNARVTGTTALQANITTFTVNANNTLTVRVLTATPAGVATDMAATDTLRLLIMGAESNA